MEGTIGQIMLFGGNFAPRNWAFCNGQLISISSNSSLFSVLGTIYGGDGRTSFALPDLRGRAPIHPGTGAGLPSYREGQRGGNESVKLTKDQIPSHTHGLTNANVQVGAEGKGSTKTDNPAGGFISSIGGGFSTTPGSGNMGGTPNGASDSAGGGASHSNMQPFLAINYIVCLQGIYPSRS